MWYDPNLFDKLITKDLPYTYNYITGPTYKDVIIKVIEILNEKKMLKEVTGVEMLNLINEIEKKIVDIKN